MYKRQFYLLDNVSSLKYQNKEKKKNYPFTLCYRSLYCFFGISCFNGAIILFTISFFNIYYILMVLYICLALHMLHIYNIHIYITLSLSLYIYNSTIYYFVVTCNCWSQYIIIVVTCIYTCNFNLHWFYVSLTG